MVECNLRSFIVLLCFVVDDHRQGDDTERARRSASGVIGQWLVGPKEIFFGTTF